MRSKQSTVMAFHDVFKKNGRQMGFDSDALQCIQCRVVTKESANNVFFSFFARRVCVRQRLESKCHDFIERSLIYLRQVHSLLLGLVFYSNERTSSDSVFNSQMMTLTYEDESMRIEASVSVIPHIYTHF